jgi:hypothetical protein
MVQWKGYGPEHSKWEKHSDVFTKDAIDAYYRRYPNTLRRIASAAFDLLSFQRCDKAIHFICRDTVIQGGVMSGGPPLRPPFGLGKFRSGFAPTLALTLASGTSVHSCWHMLCDQAWDHFRHLQTHPTG